MIDQPSINNKNAQYPARRNPRLSEYDYSNAGYYFVTICTHKRACLFGKIIADNMCLNDAGRMIASIWMDLPQRFDRVDLDSFVVMPNHIHGIIILDKGIQLSRVIQAFKSIGATEYIRGVRQQGWKEFDQSLWLRSFHDHVIRNGKDLLRIQEYIINNPLQWAIDDENPDHTK